jgi:hypothetical protein
MLTGAQGASIDQLSKLVREILEAAGLTPEQRIDVLGGAFAAEAIGPHWRADQAPDEAHASLRIADEELCDAVEAVAQVLLGRAQSREEAAEALAELDRLFAPALPAVPPSAVQPGLFDA